MAKARSKNGKPPEPSYRVTVCRPTAGAGIAVPFVMELPQAFVTLTPKGPKLSAEFAVLMYEQLFHSLGYELKVALVPPSEDDHGQ